MARARKIEQLILTTPNEVGVLAGMAEELAKAGINIIHIGAYVKNSHGFFMIVSDNNNRASEILTDMGYDVNISQTLEIEFDNAAGALAPIARKLSNNGIDMEYMFATSANGDKVACLASTSDNDMAIELVNR